MYYNTITIQIHYLVGKEHPAAVNFVPFVNRHFEFSFYLD